MKNKAENKFSLKYLTAILIAGLMIFSIIGCTTLNSPDTPFPNAYTINSGATEITFTDIPADCTIEIYNLSGELIRKIEISSGNGQYAWDLKNSSGESLRSGIYTYRIKSSQSEQNGKIVITR